MWWLDPGREILNVIFNRILAPYVENLDMSQVSYGISQGELTLKNLRIRKGVFDKYRLPLEVVKGHLGTFSLNFHWRDLGNKPVEVKIEDVYILTASTSTTIVNLEDDERNAQALKLEKLENAEILHARSGTDDVTGEQSRQNQGLIASLTAKVLNNLQITVKNVHVRYEDNQSDVDHPFAAGLTLSGFTAISTDAHWQPSFIESTAGSIHKFAKLESLGVYFDTDIQTLDGLSDNEFLIALHEMISEADRLPEHQFILKPVTGEGRITMNHESNKDMPHVDIQLSFDEIAFLLSKHQYQDLLSLFDLYHYHASRYKYLAYRPNELQLAQNRSRALFYFACQTVLDQVHKKNAQWSWSYFKERRDDRKRYIELFRKKLLGSLDNQDLPWIQTLEHKLTYRDLRLYRSICRSQLKKDKAARKKLQEGGQLQQQSYMKTWRNWIWGLADTNDTGSQIGFDVKMTDQQRIELYEALDYDEKAALTESLSITRDTLKFEFATRLNKGSVSLTTDSNVTNNMLLSLMFDDLQAQYIQRTDNFKMSVSLGDVHVFDDTTQGTLYRQIVHVKGDCGQCTSRKCLNHQLAPIQGAMNPFFSLTFEHRPFDERVDSSLSVYMQSMEIIYHIGYVEAIYKFFKPKPSQWQSVELLLDVANETFEGIRSGTRSSLENALQSRKTIDLRLELHAPIIIIPESVVINSCNILLLDAGQISIESSLADKRVILSGQVKKHQEHIDDDNAMLESLMYDKYSVKLEAAQLVCGYHLDRCRQVLDSNSCEDGLHLLERVNMELALHVSIAPTLRNLARFKIIGKLPMLQINFSDTKYKAILRLLEVVVPHFDAADFKPNGQFGKNTRTDPQLGILLFNNNSLAAEDLDYSILDDGDTPLKTMENDLSPGGYDPYEGKLHQSIVYLAFQVEILRARILRSSDITEERLIGDVEFSDFSLNYNFAEDDMKVDIKLRSMLMRVLRGGQRLTSFITCPEAETLEDMHLMKVVYSRIRKALPEPKSIYDGIEQNLDVRLSVILLQLAPGSILTIYDFITTTFKTQDGPAGLGLVEERSGQNLLQDFEVRKADVGLTQLNIGLASVQVTLENDNLNLVTISLSTVESEVKLQAECTQVTARIGSLSIADNSMLQIQDSIFKQILSVEGEEFAEIRYCTYDLVDQKERGVNHSFCLTAGSMKFHFLEAPLHDVYLFIRKLARLKSLYDIATQAAVQKVSELERLKFQINVKSPTLVFPYDAAVSADIFTVRLGEFVGSNVFQEQEQNIHFSLRGIQLTNTSFRGTTPNTLKLMDNFDITAYVLQSNGQLSPQYRITVVIDDVSLILPQLQYGKLYNVGRAISRVLDEPQSFNSRTKIGQSQAILITEENTNPMCHKDALLTTLEHSFSFDHSASPAFLNLSVSLNTINLHLFDESAYQESDLKLHGIVQIVLEDSLLRLTLFSRGTLEAELLARTFTLFNSRPGTSKFRDIIPAADHNRKQIRARYSRSNNRADPGTAFLSVDAPLIVLAMDPLFALKRFFLSTMDSDKNDIDNTNENYFHQVHVSGGVASEINLRVDFHHVSISILADDRDLNSQAVNLTIKQVLLSRQGILALTANGLRMSLLQMNGNVENIKILDDTDVTLSLDSRQSSLQRTLNIEISALPITIRVSYWDVILMKSICRKVLEPFSTSDNQKKFNSERVLRSTTPSISNITAELNMQQDWRKSEVIMSEEKLHLAFDSFQFILINMHEIPLIHLETKPFIVSIDDWSKRLHVTTTIETSLNYFNQNNSHWEPLIDPWTVSLLVLNEPSTGVVAKLTSQKGPDFNCSASSVESIMTIASVWNGEDGHVLQKARGSSAPYRIRNRTGNFIRIWSDADVSTHDKDNSSAHIQPGDTIDWRFDDWRITREILSSNQNVLGIQFEGKPWDLLCSIPVDREGEFVYSLKPSTNEIKDKLVCEITMEHNVKVVTLRSTYKVENKTLYPLDIMLVDESGNPMYTVEKIGPSQDYIAPIESVSRSLIRIQPEQGFGYRWSTPINWRELHKSNKGGTISCVHTTQHEAPFRIQVCSSKDRSTRDYPILTLVLRAPLELENLLPCNVQYKLYDKNREQHWSSYLRSGGVIPIHTIQLTNLILLNITILDTGFKPSDFAIINIESNSDFDKEDQIVLRDSQERILNLKLNYVKYQDSNGSFKVQIYSPYILINKNGLPFSLRSIRRPSVPKDVAIGENSAYQSNQSIPFMFSHPNRKGHEFIMKIGDSHWSEAISFKALSAESAVVLPSTTQKLEFHVGLSWKAGSGRYKMTKFIVLAPRFLIRNALDQPIFFRERGSKLNGHFEVQCGQRLPIHFISEAPEKLFTFAYASINAIWSMPINIEDIGTVYIRMYPSSPNSNPQLISVDIALDNATIFIKLTPNRDNISPFIVENDSIHEVTFSQTDSDQAVAVEQHTYKLKPNTRARYAWDYPARSDKRIHLICNGYSRDINMMEIGNLSPLKIGSEDVLSLDVRANGPSQVLSITDYKEEYSLYKTTNVHQIRQYDNTAFSTPEFEAVQSHVSPIVSILVELAGCGISFVNGKLIEISYLSIGDFKFEYSYNILSQSYNLSFGTFQVDNQMHDAQFPVLLQSSPLMGNAHSTNLPPTLQASFIILNDSAHGVVFIKYASVLLQAMTLKLDEVFLHAMLDLVTSLNLHTESHMESEDKNIFADIVDPSIGGSGQSIYFEVLELQPLVVSVSFVRNISTDDDTSLKLTSHNPVAVIMNAMTMTIGNLENANLQFNALGLKDVRLTFLDFQSRIIYHYRQELLRQIYRLIGSADFLGNPVGLFTNVSSGVADIFYEPWRGAVMHGNKELGIGLAKGAASFVKKTVFGISDSVSRVTGSFGKGLSAATFDSAYQARRRREQRRNPPRHFLYGMTAGAGAFASSLASGVEGLATKPLEGVEAEGAVGFFKGVGKGVIGAFTKPVVGVFDFASNVSEGIRNTTTVFDAPQKDRMRKPRLVPADGILKPYSQREALGQYWLRDLNNGEFQKDYYVAHINIFGSNEGVILTTNRILFFSTTRLHGATDMPLKNLQTAVIEDTGIRFISKLGKEYDQFVPITNKASQNWFFNAVSSVVKAFNAQRRVDRDMSF